MTRHGQPPVLVVATSREDRRALFDALDGVSPGEILSARDAIHARALLRQSPRPMLAILDFEHAPTQSKVLRVDLEGMPVIGLFGAHSDVRAETAGVRAWLRVPVDTTEASVRIREVLGEAEPEIVPVPGDLDEEPPRAVEPESERVASLRMLAQFLQPGRDATGLPGFVQRAMETLGVDLMVVAERGDADDALEPLARIDRLSSPGAPDPLRAQIVRQALDGDAVICADANAAAEQDAAFARALACARCAAMPLYDAHRNVLGVMVCAARQVDGVDAQTWEPLLEIVASRFAAMLELRAEHERGRSRALRDGLTGLPNRMLFNDRLESTLHDARRTGELFAVLFVDLDRFKGINDSLGHAVGDQVLVAEAKRLLDSVRASDTVARYAGDEFTIILRHVNDRADVGRVAAKLLQGMQAPLTLDDGSELHVTASIGVSVYPDDAADAEGLLKHADVAMYSAKGQGRNTVQAFGNVPGDAHRQRLEMEARLRNAETNGELCVHYQPQIDLASEAIVGVEALVRWRHPVLGMLSPGFFVPLAEETGLIISIGEWVLRRACTDVAIWQRRSAMSLRLAVNLSALQWMQPNLIAMVESACKGAKFDPHMLDLEGTEAVLTNPPPELLATITALRRLGCRTVIDDVGAGRFAHGGASRGVIADTLKVDRIFVQNIGRDPDDEAVVTSILDAARQRHRRVVAEGVESERQLEFLRERGCEAAQGYLFCRPLGASAFTSLLAARRSLSADGDNPLPSVANADDDDDDTHARGRVVRFPVGRKHGAAG